MANYQKVEIGAEAASVPYSDEDKAKIEQLQEESAAQDAERLDSLEKEQQAEAPLTEDPERPEWLPEKFSDGESLAKAYTDLEAEFSKRSSDESPKEQEGGLQRLTVDDFKDFTEELGQTGDVSEDSKQQLIDWGLPKEIVDAHVAGQKAILQLQLNSVYNEVGGEKAYRGMIDWATQNLDAADQRAFDQAVSGGSEDQMMFAVRSLASRWSQAGGYSQELIQGSTGIEGASGGFRSLSELTAAMKDPRYAKDPAYRNDVEVKLSNSDIL